jgi:hypothetical protein
VTVSVASITFLVPSCDSHMVIATYVTPAFRASKCDDVTYTRDHASCFLHLAAMSRVLNWGILSLSNVTDNLIHTWWSDPTSERTYIEHLQHLVNFPATLVEKACASRSLGSYRCGQTCAHSLPTPAIFAILFCTDLSPRSERTGLCRLGVRIDRTC